MKIYTVDAFANEPFKGNPAGVCIVDEFPDQDLMQNISMELGYSNTAFVKNIGDQLYHIRWFTTLSEAPICGHATVATAHVLCGEHNLKSGTEISFTSASGDLKAEINGDNTYTLNFPSYQVDQIESKDELLNLFQQDMGYVFFGFSKNCFFIELENKDFLRIAQPDLNRLKSLPCRALILTCRGDDKYDFFSRYFAPVVGIDEDPVCASAHCRLIPYWSNKLGKQELLAYQLSARGGEIKCKNLLNRVLISGKAVTVMISQTTF